MIWYFWILEIKFKTSNSRKNSKTVDQLFISSFALQIDHQDTNETSLRHCAGPIIAAYQHQRSQIDWNKVSTGNAKKVIQHSKVITQCLKIMQKVSIVNDLCGQKLIEHAQNGAFWQVFDNLKFGVKQRYQLGQF